MGEAESREAPVTALKVPLGEEEFAAAILNGLGASPKSLPSRFFYDQHGSELFEQICELPEYYPTRTEAAILQANAKSITKGVASDSVLVEFGSGSSLKTEILLQAMPHLRAYVPIDVSPSALEEARERLESGFPNLDIHPICADFSKTVSFPEDLRACAKIGFFPGSTIGNLRRAQARALLETFRVDLQPGGHLIVGVDLLKNRDILRLAYDDPTGVTAAFNLNILAHINRVFGVSFDLGAFRHEARFNEAESRIEMHLVSKHQQSVELLDQRFDFRSGETIHTEDSHKYTISGFGELAEAAGWRTGNVWTDDNALFSVHELVSQ